MGRMEVWGGEGQRVSLPRGVKDGEGRGQRVGLPRSVRRISVVNVSKGSTVT